MDVITSVFLTYHLAMELFLLVLCLCHRSASTWFPFLDTSNYGELYSLLVLPLRLKKSTHLTSCLCRVLCLLNRSRLINNQSWVSITWCSVFDSVTSPPSRTAISTSPAVSNDNTGFGRQNCLSHFFSYQSTKMLQSFLWISPNRQGVLKCHWVFMILESWVGFCGRF